MEIKESKKEKLVDFALSLLGTPYEYGAQRIDNPVSFDCSSFVWHVFRNTTGVELPKRSLEQAAHVFKIGAVIIYDRNGVGPRHKDFSQEDLEAGDLIFYEGLQGNYNHTLWPRELSNGKARTIGHAAIYIGGGKIIHAAGKPYGRVLIQKFNSKRVKAKKIQLIARLYI